MKTIDKLIFFVPPFLIVIVGAMGLTIRPNTLMNSMDNLFNAVILFGSAIIIILGTFWLYVALYFSEVIQRLDSISRNKQP